MRVQRNKKDEMDLGDVRFGGVIEHNGILMIKTRVKDVNGIFCYTLDKGEQRQFYHRTKVIYYPDAYICLHDEGN